MAKYVYGALVRQEQEGGWWAEIPDLPGCFGQGATFMEAIESISDSLETHLASLADYGLPIPEATSLKSDDARVVYLYANTDETRLGESSVSAAEAARMLNVTPGRVSQLIREKKLDGRRTLDGTNVTLTSIEAYQATRRPAGRPRVQEA
ncbi:type II toxin-antitoxin system HicB family antitoxin [uncultured Adlercreutzia sp.]|nr:type II toxin-antitoxin system HicB family antitoxin [uncultured Adlercreutzia sp.]MCI9261114.1 type II toxin-antitoxin system HicB family antitoxin [Eggerthellaceae bacterium]